jgi:hypothetical protein
MRKDEQLQLKPAPPDSGIQKTLASFMASYFAFAVGNIPASVVGMYAGAIVGAVADRTDKR